MHAHHDPGEYVTKVRRTTRKKTLKTQIAFEILNNCHTIDEKTSKAAILRIARKIVDAIEAVDEEE